MTRRACFSRLALALAASLARLALPAPVERKLLKPSRPECQPDKHKSGHLYLQRFKSVDGTTRMEWVDLGPCKVTITLPSPSAFGGFTLKYHVR
jgi:hypothetical protein